MRKLTYLVLGVAVLCVILAIVLGYDRPKSVPSSPPVEPRSDTRSAAQQQLDKQQQDEMDALVQDIRKPHTMEQIQMKGMPITPPLRRKAYLQTADQTTQEVVRDLGNFFTIANSNHFMTGTFLANIRRWHEIILPNIKVARLIQEGREKPEVIGDLLRAEIRTTLEDFDRVREEREVYIQRIRRGEVRPPDLAENDSYYNEHRRYSDLYFEYDRCHDLIYMSLCILANIGQLDESTLAAWIRTKKAVRCDCPAMDVWLIRFLQKSAPKSTYSPEVSQILEKVPFGKCRISTWTAAWSVNDPMLMMAEIDVSDLPTLEVAEIPIHIAISNEEANAVLAEFLARNSEKPQ